MTFRQIEEYYKKSPWFNLCAKDIKIEDSVISHVSSADKIIIYGSVIHNANILNMEVDDETSIKYINDNKVLCKFAYGKNIVMTTDDAFFISGEEYDLDEYKNNEVYKNDLLPIINLLTSKKDDNEFDAETLNDAE